MSKAGRSITDTRTRVDEVLGGVDPVFILKIIGALVALEVALPYIKNWCNSLDQHTFTIVWHYPQKPDVFILETRTGAIDVASIQVRGKHPSHPELQLVRLGRAGGDAIFSCAQNPERFDEFREANPGQYYWLSQYVKMKKEADEGDDLSNEVQ